MKKREVLILIISSLILVSFSFIMAVYPYTNSIPDPGHGGDEVFIYINGNEIDLQTAINNGNFSIEFTGIGSYSGPSFPHGHIGNEIIINVNNAVKTLQQSINDESLCNFTGGTNSSFGIITRQDQTGDEIWVVNQSGSGKTLQESINNGDFYQCIPIAAGYSLNYLARQYSGSGGASWYDLVQNNTVIDGASRSGVTYSSTQGNWVPVSTITETLKLNINAGRNQGGSDPRSGFRTKYRVWGDKKVSIKTELKGETHQSAGRSGWEPVFAIRLSRTDTFQRSSDNIISINGASQTINLGQTYQIQRVNWYPGDHGSGYGYLNIINVNSEYFDVEQVVWEYDEQHDSAHTGMVSYIEPA